MSAPKKPDPELTQLEFKWFVKNQMLKHGYTIAHVAQLLVGVLNGMIEKAQSDSTAKKR